MKKVLLSVVLIPIVIIFGFYVCIVVYQYCATSYLDLVFVDFRTDERIEPTKIELYCDELNESGGVEEVTSAEQIQNIIDYLSGIPLKYKGYEINIAMSDKPLGYIPWLYKSPIPEDCEQSLYICFCNEHQNGDGDKIIGTLCVYDNEYIEDGRNCNVYKPCHNTDIISDIKSILGK